ncbi:unnamed protein product [Calicophoron daubneyi]|uniref:Protein kinase domain-containing protein n=1 Tax=Calicophoron daubneyi TaxID=300641 RepID=A0AAV2TD51_CALDB
MSRLSLRLSPQNHHHEPKNPALECANIGAFRGRAGPDLVWFIHNAMQLGTKIECSVFIFEKRSFEKNSKIRRKEVVFDALRNEVLNLNRIKNSRFLQLVNGLLENNDYITYISEPVTGSLADLFEESKLTDALRFLHSTQEMMHCNVNPNAVLIAHQGQWKLGGLNFLERIVDTTKVSPKFTGYSTKLPRAAQPNLDYIAPEAQLCNSMSPLADMFSLGMLLCAIYNEGHSLIECDYSPATYVRKLPEIPGKFEEISERLPKSLVEPTRKMISQDVRDRPTSQLFALLKVFNEPKLLSYEGLLSLDSRSLNQKKEFFNRFVKVVNEFEQVVRYEYILPMLIRWYNDCTELAPFVLPSLLTMIQSAKRDEYAKFLRGHLLDIISREKTVQISVVLVDMLELYISRLNSVELEQYILPEVFSCLESGTARTLESVQKAIAVLPVHVTEEHVKQRIMQRLFDVATRTSTSVKVKQTSLECLETLVSYLSASTICDLFIPSLSHVRGTDPGIIMGIVAIDKHLMSNQKISLSCKLIVENLTPPLIDAVIAPTLNLNDFRSLMDLLRYMMDVIDRQRTYELILGERRSQSGSCLNVSSTNNVRNLPLIAMQRPTMEGDLMSTETNDGRFLRSGFSDYRRSSGSEVSSVRNWNRTNLQLQRLRASVNRSESVLYNLRQRNSISGAEKNWNDQLASSPSAYKAQSNVSSRLGGSSLQISSPFRRHSGVLPSRTLTSQEPLGSLHVPQSDGKLLDPRRHSYGCSPTASSNSLLTVNVCEGPFVTQSSSRLSINRLNQPSLSQQSSTFRKFT